MMTSPAQSFALALIASPLLLGACQSSAAVAPQIASAPPPPAFIEAACGGCHAVEPPFLSPNPAAPPFKAIANREGLTYETLKTWLTDAHNYPEQMDFDLEAAQVDQVARYMLTLRREQSED